jgi:hypothetical protein
MRSFMWLVVGCALVACDSDEPGAAADAGGQADASSDVTADVGADASVGDATPGGDAVDAGAEDSGGEDVTTEDVGTEDAGTADVAADAGPDDSGVADAGADSGVADAGADAGLADAGGDAGGADAGADASDAGPADAGGAPDADPPFCTYFNDPIIAQCGGELVQIWVKNAPQAGCPKWYSYGGELYGSFAEVAQVGGCEDCEYVPFQAVDFLTCQGPKSGYEVYEAQGCEGKVYSTPGGLLEDLCEWEGYACYCEP